MSKASSARKFAKAMANLYPKPPNRPKQVLIACSGGLDSMVLLDLLKEYGARNPKNAPQLSAVYVNHGQRSKQETDRDEQTVKLYCERHTIKFYVKRLKLEKNASEATLREARYGALRTLAQTLNATVFTAHHGDDNLETYLFRLLRGAHPTSLRGIRAKAKRGNLRLARPLLGFLKDELRDYALSQHLNWSEDQTNKSSHYARNRIRNELVPLFKDLRNASPEKLLKFFLELESQSPKISVQKAARVKENLTSKEGHSTQGISFEHLKSAIDLLLKANAQRTTQSHWQTVKRLLIQRQSQRRGGGETKTVQFPGENSLVFKGNRLFWLHKNTAF